VARRRASRHLRRRSPFARWTGRLLGLAGTAAVLAAGIVAVTMLLSLDDDEIVDEAPAATLAPEADGQREGSGKAKAPKLTSDQRAQRRRAVELVRSQGYTPATLADYKVDHLLRVLIGEPAGTTPAGRRAFFFVDDEYIGQDATTASAKLRPGRQLEREITLVYTLYGDGDEACCPKGKEVRVHFRWDGNTLTPREEIPADSARLRVA